MRISHLCIIVVLFASDPSVRAILQEIWKANFETISSHNISSATGRTSASVDSVSTDTGNVSYAEEGEEEGEERDNPLSTAVTSELSGELVINEETDIFGHFKKINDSGFFLLRRNKDTLNLTLHLVWKKWPIETLYYTDPSAREPYLSTSIDAHAPTATSTSTAVSLLDFSSLKKNILGKITYVDPSQDNLEGTLMGTFSMHLSCAVETAEIDISSELDNAIDKELSSESEDGAGMATVTCKGADISPEIESAHGCDEEVTISVLSRVAKLYQSVRANNALLVQAQKNTSFNSSSAVSVSESLQFPSEALNTMVLSVDLLESMGYPMAVATETNNEKEFQFDSGFLNILKGECEEYRVTHWEHWKSGSALMKYVNDRMNSASAPLRSLQMLIKEKEMTSRSSARKSKVLSKEVILGLKPTNLTATEIFGAADNFQDEVMCSFKKSTTYLLASTFCLAMKQSANSTMTNTHIHFTSDEVIGDSEVNSNVIIVLRRTKLTDRWGIVFHLNEQKELEVESLVPGCVGISTDLKVNDKVVSFGLEAPVHPKR